jgi:hypothetical protein
MWNVRSVWWIPILLCIIAGVLSFIPLDTSEDGSFLPYKPLIPLAPISSLLIWFVGGGFFYLLGRRATTRPIRTPYK